MIQTKLFDFKFIPAQKKSDRLMIVFHGRGDSLRPFGKFDRELNIPDMNYLLLNAPRKFLDGYSWYGEPPYQKTGVLKLRNKLLKLIDEIESQGWNRQKMYLFGFSQGCLVSTDLALNSPKPFAGLIGVSGYFQFFPRWRNQISNFAKQTPWLLTHGRKDDILRIEDTRYGVEKLRESGISIRWIEMNKAHTLEASEYPVFRRWLTSDLDWA